MAHNCCSSCKAIGVDLFLYLYEIAFGTTSEYLCQECYDKVKGAGASIGAVRGITVGGHIWISDHEEPGGRKWIT